MHIFHIFENMCTHMLIVILLRKLMLSGVYLNILNLNDFMTKRPLTKRIFMNECFIMILNEILETFFFRLIGLLNNNLYIQVGVT